jgi:hypothetical protein
MAAAVAVLHIYTIITTTPLPPLATTVETLAMT